MLSARHLLSQPSSQAAAAALGRRFYTSVTSKADRIQRALAAKAQAGLSYDELAAQLGVTNTYAAQLLLGQAKLIPEIAVKLRKAIPALSDEDIQDMQDSFPMRSFDDEILKEPNIYRTYEAVTHYGEAIKSIINEKAGDGIINYEIYPRDHCLQKACDDGAPFYCCCT